MRLPVSIIYIVLLFLLGACSKKSDLSRQPPPPPSVEVVTLVPQDVSLEPAYPGRTQGSEEVDVRARVTGILLKCHYLEGSSVKEGDPLFQIDPELYQAEVDRATAELEQAHALLHYAELNWTRVAQLFKEKAVSEQVKDQGFHDFESAKADESKAKAQLNTAKINLGYTFVSAPITGITILQTVDEGNYIQVDNLLTHIVQLDPIHVLFSYPDKEFFRLRQLYQALDNNKKSDVELFLEDGSRYSRKGYIDFTDVTINRQTATVQVRAIFPNPNNEILAGEFVRVQLKDVVLKDALLVPQEAVMQGPGGTFVYCVDKDNIARLTPIEVGPSKDNFWVVDKGLSAGDTIVSVGMIKVRPDKPVQIISSTNKNP